MSCATRLQADFCFHNEKVLTCVGVVCHMNVGESNKCTCVCVCVCSGFCVSMCVCSACQTVTVCSAYRCVCVLCARQRQAGTRTEECVCATVCSVCMSVCVCVKERKVDKRVK